MSYKGRNSEPTLLMEAQLESLKRNAGSELIKAADKRHRPNADASVETKFETRPLRGRRHRSDPA
jgi:hypothetical protein